MKCETEIAKIRIACRVAAQALQLAEEASFPGITTAEVFFYAIVFRRSYRYRQREQYGPTTKKSRVADVYFICFLYGVLLTSGIADIVKYDVWLAFQHHISDFKKCSEFRRFPRKCRNNLQWKFGNLRIICNFEMF